ncbi:MAG: hypothetical protein MZW92_59710 [Comamonadaceae bacterium]|nr:hypothetical protein [Comamonadaceae bacterium]
MTNSRYLGESSLAPGRADARAGGHLRLGPGRAAPAAAPGVCRSGQRRDRGVSASPRWPRRGAPPAARCACWSAAARDSEPRRAAGRRAPRPRRAMRRGPRARGSTASGAGARPPRRPRFNEDDSRRALRQLQLAFTGERADVVISVGGWPIADAARYRAAAGALALSGGRRTVVMATGELSAAQQALLRDGLIHGIVAIDFEQMGRYAYRGDEAHRRRPAGRPGDPHRRDGAPTAVTPAAR